MKVIIFGKIVGVICSLIMVLSGRSQANVNPEPAYNEDSSASEVCIPIDNLESMLNGGNVNSVVESASPAGDVSKAASSASEVNKTVSPINSADQAPSSASEVSKAVFPINSADQAPSSASGVKRLRSPLYFSQSDISESDEGYSSDDESWSSSESEESFSGDEGRALAELNKGCGYPENCEKGLDRSEINSLRQYLYCNLTESESEEDWSSSESGVSLSDE